MLAKNKNVEEPFKKIAVVIDDNGNFEEYFDAPDDEMTYQQFVRAVRQTMIGFDLDAHIQAFEDDDPYDRDKIMKAAEILGVSEYIDDDEIAIENAVEMIDDEVIEYISDLEVKAGESVTATPAGIPFYKYEEILDKFPFEKMRVDIEEPDYSGYETITLDVGGVIDISDYLEGTGYVYRPGVEEELGGEHEQDVVDAVYNALEYAGFDVYGGTVEQSYEDSERVYFSIRYDAAHDIDKLDVFEVMLEDLLNVDKEIRGETFGKNIISSLEGDELIQNPELEKQKAEEEADEKFKASKDADYFASREEREKQMKLALQERKFRILIKKS